MVHLASRYVPATCMDSIPTQISSDPLTSPLDFFGAWAPLCPDAVVFVPAVSLVEEQQQQQQQITTNNDTTVALASILFVLADQVANIHTASGGFRETLCSSASSANARGEELSKLCFAAAHQPFRVKGRDGDQTRAPQREPRNAQP